MLKDIPGYEGLYACADYDTGGKVWSHKYKKWIGSETNGYATMCLSKDKKVRKKRQHRLVWETFVGKIPKGYDVHHKDGDRKNNRLSNLELMKRSEHNKKHSTGNSYANRKVRYEVTGEVYDSIDKAAKETGVHRCTVSRHCNGIVNCEKKYRFV